MLVNMKQLLDKAREGNYAVAMPDVFNEFDARVAIEAAEELNAPILLGVLYTGHPDLFEFGRLLRDLGKAASVPVATILDHGASYEQVVAAIQAGFTSVMIDRSSLPFDENVAQVAELVKIAHAVDVSVEAELGHVGSGENYDHDGNSALTVPEEAVRYVQQTGVDALAVAIGSAHGVYKGTPKLRFELLQQLREQVPVPLVLHGGSGTGDDNLQKACQSGINKVNVCNDLLRNAIETLNSEDLSGNNVYNMYPLLAKGWKSKLQHFIKLFGSADQNWAAGAATASKASMTNTEGLDESKS